MEKKRQAEKEEDEDEENFLLFQSFRRTLNSYFHCPSLSLLTYS
jgi:hypothetical protein